MGCKRAHGMHPPLSSAFSGPCPFAPRLRPRDDPAHDRHSRHPRLPHPSGLSGPSRAGEPRGDVARGAARGAAGAAGDAAGPADVGPDVRRGPLRLDHRPQGLPLFRDAIRTAWPGRRSRTTVLAIWDAVAPERPRARMLPHQLVRRGRADGPASGPRRGRLHPAGRIGLARRRGALPHGQRGRAAARPNPSGCARATSWSWAARRACAITASTASASAPPRCCRRAGGSTSPCAS